MSLFKKIIILVNLILCIFCINVFAVPTITKENNPNFYTTIQTLINENIEEYPYILGFSNGDYVNFWFCSVPMYRYPWGTSQHRIVRAPSNMYSNPTFTDETYNFVIYQYRYDSTGFTLSTESKDTNETSVSVSDIFSQENYEDSSLVYCNFDFHNVTGSYVKGMTITDEIYASNYDRYDIGTGININPPFDDTIIDWESAFDFYVGSLDRENIDGKSYEYAGHYYADKLYLFWALHSLDNTISVTATEQYGFWYYLESELEFIFTDSKGEKHSEIISTINLFDDSISAFELPYLVQDSSLEKEEQYDSFLMALEFYFGSFTGNYENWEAWFNECVECYVDSYGYFDYEIILHSKVYKTYWSDTTIKEEIYTYADIPITYDMNSSSFVKASDGPSIFYPDKNDKDFYYIIGPDGEIIGVVDNSDNYDVDDDNYTVDKDGNTIGRPEVDENGNANFVDKDGNIIEPIPIGPELPTPDEIIDNIEVIGNYDLSRIFTGLKNELEELLEGNSLFNKFANMFQQVINWLPFSIKSLFFILISFYLIFEFIHILRK